MSLDPQAIELNEDIKKTNPAIFELLSKKGKEIFFPKAGIPSQAAQAASTEINATIGMAFDEDGTTMCLPSIEKLVSLPKAEVFNYEKGAGNPELRSTWKEMMIKKNSSLKDKEISKPVVTAALTNGISLAGYLFIEENDEIIVPDLYWENYDLAFKNGWSGKLNKFPTFTDNGRFNTDGLRKKVEGSKTDKVIIILNFPNNPTGYSPTIDESDTIKSILVNVANSGKKIVVISDDAYFGLIYKDGVSKESIFTYLADAHENILAIKLDGPTKEDYVWGFRVGFMTFATKLNSEALYSALEWKLTGAIRGSISNVTKIGQSLLLKAYKSDSYGSEKQAKYDILKRRYDTVVKTLENHKEYDEVFKALPFNSGYFMCVEINSNINANELRLKLIEKYKTGTVVIGSAIRIAFSAVPDNKLATVFENIYQAGLELKK